MPDAPTPDTPASVNAAIIAVKDALDHLRETISEYQQTNTAQRKEQIEAESKAVVPLPVEITKYYASEESERPKTNLRNRIRMVLEIAGVITAIILACLTYRTLRALNQQVAEMARQYPELQKSANAARDGADAAKSASVTASNSLKDSVRNFQIEQRPYMAAKIPVFATNMAPQVGIEPAANVTYTNIGKTPATGILVQLSFLRFRPKPKAELGSTKWLFDFIEGAFKDLGKAKPSDPKIARLARQDLAPGDAHFSTGALKGPLTANEMTDLINGDLTLFLIGTIAYSDPYGKRYETQFCDLFFGSDQIIWHVCDSHNTIE